MKRALAKAAPEDLVEEFDVEQGSEDWFAMHIGVPTASVFRTIMSESRDGPDTGVRASLLRRFAAEVIFERPMETFSNADMERGKAQEPWLIGEYEVGAHRKAFARREKAVPIRKVGFVRRTIRDPLMMEPLVVGCSPDGLVGDDGGVETKSMRPDLIVKLLDSRAAGGFPSEHHWQLFGSMWVTGRKWWDLKIGYEGFPLSPQWRLERNEHAIALLRDGVEMFAHDLRKLVARVRAKGTR